MLLHLLAVGAALGGQAAEAVVGEVEGVAVGGGGREVAEAVVDVVGAVLVAQDAARGVTGDGRAEAEQAVVGACGDVLDFFVLRGEATPVVGGIEGQGGPARPPLRVA